MSISILFGFLFIIAIDGAKWPSLLKRCSLSDPQLNSCLQKNVKQAIPIMAKGIPEIGLKSLDPLVGTSFNLSANTPLVSGNAWFTNVTITGLSNVNIKNVTFDKKRSAVKIHALYNQVQLKGNYSMDASIVYIPIKSKGTFVLDMVKFTSSHAHRFANSLKHAGHGKINYRIGPIKTWKIELHDPAIGESVSAFFNRIINSNTGIIWSALIPSISLAWQQMYERALKSFVSQFTLNDLFLVET